MYALVDPLHDVQGADDADQQCEHVRKSLYCTVAPAAPKW
jgi:hypothetical protein